MAKTNYLPKAAGVLMLSMLLAACSTDGDSRAELRKLAGVEASPTPLRPTQIVLTATPQPESTEPPVVIEATREIAQPVEVTQAAQIIERTVEVVITATPDIQGFQDSGIDESVQPCPKPFWKRGRCVATDATVEAFANELQP